MDQKLDQLSTYEREKTDQKRKGILMLFSSFCRLSTCFITHVHGSLHVCNPIRHPDVTSKIRREHVSGFNDVREEEYERSGHVWHCLLEGNHASSEYQAILFFTCVPRIATNQSILVGSNYTCNSLQGNNDNCNFN